MYLSEEQFQTPNTSLLRNINKEGIAVWMKLKNNYYLRKM
jgi:hypothetical protein